MEFIIHCFQFFRLKTFDIGVFLNFTPEVLDLETILKFFETAHEIYQCILNLII